MTPLDHPTWSSATSLALAIPARSSCRPRQRPSLPFSRFLLSLACLWLICSTTFASESPIRYGELKQSLDPLAQTGGLFIDRRPSPHDLHHGFLHRRQSSSSLAPPSDGGIAANSTATAIPLTEDQESSSSSLPRPFDTSLGNNFTSSTCPDFFNVFLANSTFQSCLPLSLLLQNSNSFFTASKSLVRITQTLDASCNVELSTCSAVMNSLAMQIREDINCGADYRLQNPIVIQAYNGLVAYDPLYHAGCLKDSNNNYCFANAVTNTSSPSDSYIYYLALGIALPGGLTPTCNMCLQNTMAILSAAAANTSQPVSTDYAAAAQELDVGCGPSFANSTISRVVKGSDGRSLPVPSFAGIVGVAIGTAMVAVLVG